MDIKLVVAMVLLTHAQQEKNFRVVFLAEIESRGGNNNLENARKLK